MESIESGSQTCLLEDTELICLISEESSAWEREGEFCIRPQSLTSSLTAAGTRAHGRTRSFLPPPALHSHSCVAIFFITMAWGWALLARTSCSLRLPMGKSFWALQITRPGIFPILSSFSDWPQCINKSWWCTYPCPTLSQVSAFHAVLDILSSEGKIQGNEAQIKPKPGSHEPAT